MPRRPFKEQQHQPKCYNTFAFSPMRSMYLLFVRREAKKMICICKWQKVCMGIWHLALLNLFFKLPVDENSTGKTTQKGYVTILVIPEMISINVLKIDLPNTNTATTAITNSSRTIDSSLKYFKSYREWIVELNNKQIQTQNSECKTNLTLLNEIKNAKVWSDRNICVFYVSLWLCRARAIAFCLMLSYRWSRAFLFCFTLFCFFFSISFCSMKSFTYKIPFIRILVTCRLRLSWNAFSKKKNHHKNKDSNININNNTIRCRIHKWTIFCSVIDLGMQRFCFCVFININSIWNME